MKAPVAKTDAHEAPKKTAAHLTTQLTAAIGQALETVRATPLIEAVEQTLAATQLTAALAQTMETIREWVLGPAPQPKDPASIVDVRPGPASMVSGDVRPTREAHAVAAEQLTREAQQLARQQLMAQPLALQQPTTRPDGSTGGDSVPSAASPGPLAGLGSTASFAASVLIPIGLAAAVCGFAAPAIRRRLSPQPRGLNPALLASLLEQPG